jgi:hypothetical protein
MVRWFWGAGPPKKDLVASPLNSLNHIELLHITYRIVVQTLTILLTSVYLLFS